MNYFVEFFTGFLPWLLAAGAVYVAIAVFGLKCEGSAAFGWALRGLILVFIGGLVLDIFVGPFDNRMPLLIIEFVVYIGLLAWKLYNESKQRADISESAAPCVEQCLDFIEDFSHYLPGYNRQAHIYHDPDRQYIMATLWIIGGKEVKDSYEATLRGAGNTSAMADALEAGLRDPAYRFKTSFLYGVMGRMARESGSLTYTQRLVYYKDPRIMQSLLDSVNRRFPGRVQTVNGPKSPSFRVSFSRTPQG